MRLATVIIAPLALAASAATADPLNLYLGAGAGTSTIQQSYPAFAIEEHATGWKVFAGWRPLPMLGLEAEYIDLGNGNTTVPYAEDAVQQHIAASAAAAFAVGYLPQPLPYLDFYGKLGVARLTIDATEPFVCPPYTYCPALYLTPPLVSDTTRTRIAYGAGLQVKLGALGVRLEYQGIGNRNGDESLLSLDLALTF